MVQESLDGDDVEEKAEMHRRSDDVLIAFLLFLYAVGIVLDRADVEFCLCI